MRLNIVLYIYYICIFSCLAQTPSSTSHCRKRVEVYNNYGGVDVYLLRDDAAEENYGRCECYYKKIGDPETAEGQNHGYCMEESRNCNQCVTVEVGGCDKPKEIIDGFYKCDEAMIDGKENYPVNTKCTATCNNGKNDTKDEPGHIINCKRSGNRKVGWEPPENINICDINDDPCFDLSPITKIKFECKDGNGNILPSDKVTPGGICKPICEGGTQVNLELTLTCKLENGKPVYIHSDKRVIKKTDLQDLQLCFCERMPDKVRRFYECNLNGGLYFNPEVELPVGTKCQLQCGTDSSTYMNSLSTLMCAAIDPEISWIDKNNKTVDPSTINSDELCPGCKKPDDFKDGSWQCYESVETLTGLYPPNTMCIPQCNTDKELNKNKTENITCLQKGKAVDWSPTITKEMTDSFCKDPLCYDISNYTKFIFECKDENGNSAPTDQVTPGGMCKPSCEGGKEVISGYTLTCIVENGKAVYKDTNNRSVKETDLKDENLCNCKAMPKEVEKLYYCLLNGNTFLPHTEGQSPLGTECILDCKNDISVENNSLSILTCAIVDPGIYWIDKNNEKVDPVTLKPDELCPGCKNPDNVENGDWNCDKSKSSITGVYHPNTVCTVLCNIEEFYSDKETSITCLLDGNIADWSPQVNKQMIEETCKTGCKKPKAAPINGTWVCQDQDIVNKLYPLGSVCNASCDDLKVNDIVKERHGSWILCTDKDNPRWDPTLTAEDLKEICSIKGTCKNCPDLPANLSFNKCSCLDYEITKCKVECNKPDDCQYFDVFCKSDSSTGDTKIYQESESNSALTNAMLTEMCGIDSKCQQPHPFIDPRGIWSCSDDNCNCDHKCDKPPGFLELPQPPATLETCCEPKEGWKERDSQSSFKEEDWVCPNYGCSWIPEVINGTYTCKNATTGATYEVPIPNGAECTLECEDSSVDESKIAEQKMICYYRNYKIVGKTVYYKNIKKHLEILSEVCLPKCQEIPSGTYECDNDKPYIENTICNITDCAYKDCNSLAQIQCKNTKNGLKWGTTIGKWTEIQNFAEIVEKACSNPPVGCLRSELGKLDEKGSWEDCTPCICSGCSDFHPLNTNCTWKCTPPIMNPPNIGKENIPSGVNATCKGNNAWDRNGFDLKKYNNEYCPKYCEKINLPCQYCGYDCQFNKIDVQGDEFLHNTECSLNCSRSIPLSEIKCNKGTWETTEKGRPISDFQLENACGCGKIVAEKISQSNFNCRDDRDNGVPNDAEKTPPNSMCRPKCVDKTVDLSLSNYSSVSCSCIETLSIQECTNNSWTDTNRYSFDISNLQGICLTCKVPDPPKNSEWNCTGIKTTEGSWQLGTTCEQQCLGNKRLTGKTIECSFNESIQQNSWDGLAPFVYDKECPVITTYNYTIADCQCYIDGVCKDHGINTKIKRGKVLLVQPFGDKPVKSNISIEFTKKEDKYELLAHFELTPGRWVLKIDADNYFPYWTDIEVKDTGESHIDHDRREIKLDCMTKMNWIVTDKVTKATIESASLVCTEQDKDDIFDNFDPNNRRKLLKMCGMKIFTDCMEQCRITATNTANCETGCHERYISLSTDPIKDEYGLEVAHNSTTGDLSNYFHFTKHPNEWLKEPRTHFLKSGTKCKCSPKNDEHMFPGNKITEYSVFTPNNIRRYEEYNISRILNLTLNFKELEILDDYPITDGIDDPIESNNNETSTVGRRLNITPSYKVLEYTTQYIWSKDKQSKEDTLRGVTKLGSMHSHFSSKNAEDGLENIIIADKFTILDERRLTNDNLKMSLVFARWKFDFYTEPKQYGTNVETDFGSGYWEDGETIEGKEVKSYFRDEFVIEVGDPHSNYQAKGKEPPTTLTETLVRLVNVYVKVYDDKCFNFCDGITKEELRACNNVNCMPLKKEDIEVSVECAKDASKHCYRDKKSHLQDVGYGHTGEYRQGFGNISQIPSGNHTHLFVRTVGLHNIRCRAGDDFKDNSHYFNPDILHKRFIKENILIPCMLYKKLNKDPKRNAFLAKRNQREIMKLSLDWSLPNPLVPSNLGLHFVWFDHEGNGVCGSYNKALSSCDELNPGGDYQISRPKEMWDCGSEIKKAGTSNEYYGYKLNDRCCHKESKKYWRCAQEKSEALNNYGPETAIIPNTALANNTNYMLVYILDNPVSGKMSNAQLDLTMQYKDNKGIEQLKHIYMKREDSGLNKTKGNIYLPVCIEFNSKGYVRSLKRPLNQWLKMKIVDYTFLWTKGIFETRLGSTPCSKCLNLFCDFKLQTELTEEEKYNCCQCSKDLEKTMEDEYYYEENKIPLLGSISCPWKDKIFTGPSGRTCRCMGEKIVKDRRRTIGNMKKSSWSNKGSKHEKYTNLQARKNKNESFGRNNRGGDMSSFREQFFIRSDKRDSLLKDEGHMDEQEIAEDVPIEDKLDSHEETF